MPNLHRLFAYYFAFIPIAFISIAFIPIAPFFPMEVNERAKRRREKNTRGKDKFIVSHTLEGEGGTTSKKSANDAGDTGKLLALISSMCFPPQQTNTNFKALFVFRPIAASSLPRCGWEIFVIRCGKFIREHGSGIRLVFTGWGEDSFRKKWQ
jgi:hypothetical protein